MEETEDEDEEAIQRELHKDSSFLEEAVEEESDAELEEEGSADEADVTSNDQNETSGRCKISTSGWKCKGPKCARYQKEWRNLKCGGAHTKVTKFCLTDASSKDMKAICKPDW